MDLRINPAAAGAHLQLHRPARKILAEIEVFVAQNAAVGDVHHTSGKGVIFRDKAAAREVARELRRRNLVRVEGLLEAEGGHPHLGDCAVRKNLDFLHAATAGHNRVVSHAVIENVPLILDFADGAVVVARRVVDAVVHDGSADRVRSEGFVSGCIHQPAAAARRVNQVVGITDLAGRTRLVEILGLLPRGQNVLNEGVVLRVHHGVRVKLHAEGPLKAAVHIHATVVIHQNTRIHEPAVAVTHLVGRRRFAVAVLINQLKRPLRAVAHRHTPMGAHDVGIEVEFAVLFHHIRCKEIAVRPRGCITLMVGVVRRMEDVPVARPVVQIIHGRGPAQQLMVAKCIRSRLVVASVHIHAVAEHAGLTVRDILPQRQIRIGHRNLLMRYFRASGTKSLPGFLLGSG